MFRTVIDLTNKKYGKLTVVERGPNTWDDKATWKVLCECGNTKIIRASNLTRPRGTKSCGCLLKSIMKSGERKKWTEPGETAFNDLYKRYSRAAKDRNYKFTLNRGDFRTMVSGNCHYCGSEPNKYVYSDKQMRNKRINGNFKHNGIDRKDNSLGYTLENCVSCCKTCNLGKHNQSYEEFITYLSTLVKYRAVA